MYGSICGTPLTSTRLCASQHCTVSPGSPMTRLMMSCLPPTTWIQLPVAWKTTMSWRWMPCSLYDSLSTRTRSSLQPGVQPCSVFSIDPDGIRYDCTTYVRRTNVPSTVKKMRMSHSRPHRTFARGGSLIARSGSGVAATSATCDLPENRLEEHASATDLKLGTGERERGLTRADREGAVTIADLEPALEAEQHRGPC